MDRHCLVWGDRQRPAISGSSLQNSRFGPTYVFLAGNREYGIIVDCGVWIEFDIVEALICLLVSCTPFWTDELRLILFESLVQQCTVGKTSLPGIVRIAERLRAVRATAFYPGKAVKCIDDSC